MSYILRSAHRMHLFVLYWYQKGSYRFPIQYWPHFKTVLLCVYCAVRTESWSIIQVNIGLSGVKQWNMKFWSKLCGVKRANEWLSERVGGWVSKWVNEWVSEWVGGWLGEWVIEWVSEWEGEWVIEWVSGWVSKWTSEWVGEWVIEWVSEWLSERVSEWVSDSANTVEQVFRYISHSAYQIDRHFVILSSNHLVKNFV
jgi:hypothetical protein